MIRRFILAAAMAAALLASAPDGRRWWSHVQYLADDKLEGRDTGSAGHRKAAAYVAGEFVVWVLFLVLPVIRQRPGYLSNCSSSVTMSPIPSRQSRSIPSSAFPAHASF